MSGVTGINYPALECVMRMTAIPPEQQPELFEQVRFIENGFLTAINERKNHG